MSISRCRQRTSSDSYYVLTAACIVSDVVCRCWQEPNDLNDITAEPWSLVFTYRFISFAFTNLYMLLNISLLLYLLHNIQLEWHCIA